MNLSSLSDDALIASLSALCAQEREDVAGMLEHLREMDDRHLSTKLGYSSLFIYCILKLRYAEGTAYHRIRAVRAIRKRPEILELIRRGELHIEAVVLLNPHLGRPDAADLIQQAKGKTKSAVENLLAPLRVAEVRPDSIRSLGITPPPTPAETGFDHLFTQAESPKPPPPRHFVPAAPVPPSVQRFRIAFDADEALVQLVERAKALLRHKNPNGQLESLFREALDALLDRCDPDRKTSTQRRQGGRSRETRRIAQAVKDSVWRRDQGKCTFVSDDGRRCGSAQWLEYDHVVPWAKGGPSDDPSNVRLLCRAHNQFAAAEVFGPWRS
ncbi:MAG: HNH endonuclease signature motif containing protein [Elusimicrobiota bacterium]